jgi:LuxR family maltose regulon positive regulatory protein
MDGLTSESYEVNTGDLAAAPCLDELLLDVKFSVPRPRPGMVTRGSLVETACSSGRRVVAVTAPAGYGKTVFLADWAQAERRRVAWVGLDRFDDDPAMLLVSLASGCFQAGLAGADLVAAMGGPRVSVLSRAAPLLALALRASPVPFVLMLDDLHELRSPLCHDALGVVISGIPDGSALAAASRFEQPHLARLRAAGDTLEFGAADLALDAAGARQVYANAQVSLAPEPAAAVAARTEGWPVGIYLAALISKEGQGEDQLVTGDDPYVADYLYQQALHRQPEDIRRFLRRTAVLDRLCGPVCDAVLGSVDAARQLRRLEADGLFVIPLDRRREWYRYHALFREFLLGQLRRAEPEIIDTLHRRAADWHESNGSGALALEHLLHTADADRSMRLASRLAWPAYAAGQLATAQRWYRAIGDANIERYPPLALLRCWEAVLTGDTAAAQRWAALVAAASSDLVPPDGAASFDSARAMLRAAMCAGGPEPMAADAAFALAQEPAWSSWRPSALWLLGEAYLLAGRVDEARAALADASAAAASVHGHETIVSCEAGLAALAADRGEWQEAAGRLELALATIDEKGMHDYVACLLAFATAARISVHHGDLGEAHRQLTRAMRGRAAATYVLPFVAVRLRLRLARAYLALADAATARQLLREIDDIVVHRPALGALAGEVEEFRVLADKAATEAAGPSPLTPAELRLLPYLQTYLTASGIAELLFISSHTVKAEIKSIYRKLGVSSRNEAVQKALSIGLLGN